MIFDLNSASGKEFSHADVCVIGTGAVGTMLGVELARKGKRVLMLEAGGREIEEGAQDAYRSEVIGQRHNGIHTGRFRAFGGTTRKWGGQILELDAIDFEKRDWVAGSGWPFSKAELTAYYARSIAMQGAGDCLIEDAEVWRTLKEAAPELGDQLIAYFTRWCPEPDFTRLHGAELERSERVGIYLHASACAMQLAEEGGRVDGVLCRTLAGKEVLFRATQYVLCVGTIEASRFLLQPVMTTGGELREGHWNGSGLLGKHFQDHIDCNAAVVKVRDAARVSAYFDNAYVGRFKYHPKLKLTAEAQRERKTLNIGSTLFYESEMDAVFANTKVMAKRLLQGRVSEITAGQVAGAMGSLPVLMRQVARYKLKRRAYNAPSAKISLRVHCEQEPLGASSISLSDERDAFGLRRARLDWRTSEFEKSTIRNYVGVVREAFAAWGLGDVVPDASLEKDNESFCGMIDDSNHHMGGARMAVSAAEGVVNADLRLHSAENAYVCGGAVFPCSGFSNPTHTMLALAARLADHIGGVKA